MFGKIKKNNIAMFTMTDDNANKSLLSEFQTFKFLIGSSGTCR